MIHKNRKNHSNLIFSARPLKRHEQDQNCDRDGSYCKDELSFGEIGDDDQELD